MSAPMVFFFTKMLLAAVNSFTQLWLYESIQVVFGSNISQLWLWLTCVTHGNFIAATAFIPSSTCLYLSNIWLGLWLRKVRVLFFELESLLFFFLIKSGVLERMLMGHKDVEK